jgi:phosphatidylglycerophosphatase A
VSISLVGVWAGGKAANYLGTKDPQVVVIDEVSGQCLTLLLAESVPILLKLVTAEAWFYSRGQSGYAVIHVNWINLLLGFILFRVFDIWKPFPVRQAESLPGGWGIMADDWVAGIYAALGLWIARMLGL